MYGHENVRFGLPLYVIGLLKLNKKLPLASVNVSSVVVFTELDVEIMRCDVPLPDGELLPPAIDTIYPPVSVKLLLLSQSMPHSGEPAPKAIILPPFIFIVPFV
jgi:hypothetical protein